MTALAARSRVLTGGDARLTAECAACDVQLVPGAEVDAALAALDAAHPAEPHGRRTQVTPRGWRVPLSACSGATGR